MSWLLVIMVVPIDARRVNLNGTTLRVAVNMIMPYCSYRIDNSSDQMLVMEDSIEMNMLAMLSRALNFRPALQDMNFQFGNLEHGRWTGTVGAVHNNSVHFGLCSLSYDYQRAEAIRYSAYTFEEGVIMLSLAPRRKQHGWIVLAPLATEVWAAIVIAFIVIILVQFLLHRHRDYRQLFVLWLNLWAILLMKATKLLRAKERSPVVFIYFLWSAAALVLAAGYAGVYYSILTLDQYEEPIDTVAQLEELAFNDRGMIVATKASFFATHMLLGAEGGLYYTIGEHMRRNGWMLASTSTSTTIEPLQVVIEEHREHVVFLTQKMYGYSRICLRRWNPRRFHFSREKLITLYQGFVFGRNSNLIQHFDPM